MVLVICKLMSLAIGSYFIYKLYLVAYRARINMHLMRDTAYLSSESLAGEWVKFSGTIIFPNGKTEILSHPCSCWYSSVNALFVTKRKKPEKGELQHRPKLYSSSSNDAPLMIEGDQGRVQCAFESLYRTMLYPKELFKVKHLPPNQETSQKALAKYKAYEIREWYFSPSARVFGMARLAAKNRAAAVVSGSVEEARPAILYEGGEEQLRRKYQKTFNVCAIFIACIVLSNIVVWWSGILPQNTGFQFGMMLCAYLAVATILWLFDIKWGLDKKWLNSNS